MTDTTTNSPLETTSHINELRGKLQSGSEKAQLQMIPTMVEEGDAGLDVLMEFLRDRQSAPPTVVTGKIYQALYQVNLPKTVDFLQTYFPQGVVPLRSQANLDYYPLQQLILKQEFQAADKLTMEKMCELAGGTAPQRKWLYFSEVESLPVVDLQTINLLWFVHSEGKFGFSVQRELWLGVAKNWDKLWPLLGWKEGNNWTRYPQGFIWDLSAPKGHLPLANQLRGVQPFASLLSHPAWQSK